jgi:DNA-binding FrmR family transcriptional regulator
MSALDDALARLQRAAGRLEAAERSCHRNTPQAEHQLREIARQIAARVDDALARIDLALRGEN